MFNDLSVFADNISAGLEPGEQALFAGLAHYTHGHEELGREDRSVSFDPLNGVQWEPAEAAAERLVGGTTLVGFPGCLAQRLAAAATEHLVLTDQRLLAGTYGDGPLRTQWQTPRTQVAEVAHRPRLLQFGRVEVGFVDGSVVRLMLGMLSPRPARRLVAAFEQSSRG